MSGALLALQRKMAAAVMEPLTRSESTRRVRRDGVAMKQDAAAFIKPSASLSSLERLEIYNRQYWFRLYASFEEDFPGLRAVLGRRRFERVMQAYLDACPSTSFTLRDLGSRLTGFLSDHPALTAPHSRLALDVARLEWAHIEAYDATHCEAATPQFFANIQGETVLRLHPSLRLIALRYPVDGLVISARRAVEGADTLSNNATAERMKPRTARAGNLAPSDVWLAVHRQAFTVYYKRLGEEEFRMLTTIQSGSSLEEAIVSGFGKAVVENSNCAALVREMFHRWAALGWICGSVPSAAFAIEEGGHC